MIKHCIVALSVFILLFYACKPYDSDLVNKQLLQGYWKLSKIEHLTNDSTISYPLKDTTIFIFKNDSNYVYHINQQDTASYKFSINNYNIETCQKDDMTSNKYTEIKLLTNDTLILKINNTQWVCKRISPNEVMK